jgi:hypothetical protein
MSFYVKREKEGRRTGWVGPIRSYQQARREFAAWEDSGWSAKIEDSTPEIRREVREWQREADKRLGRVR